MAFDDEHWLPISGYVPLIRAEARLSAVRRAIPAVAATAEQLIQNVNTEADEYLAAVRGDPIASDLLFEAQMFADEEKGWAEDELPFMFFGQLVIYLMSILESTLAECLEYAAAGRQLPDSPRVHHPKLEKYIEALANYGVQVEWDDDIWRDLRMWRQARNAIVHCLESPFEGVTSEFGSSISSTGDLLDLVEFAIFRVDVAMDKFKESN